MILRFTPRSLENIAAIAEYIRERNPAAAQRVRAAIYESLQDLMLFPKVGRRQETAGVRKFVTRKYGYLVYYLMDDVAGEIVILSVKHPRNSVSMRMLEPDMMNDRAVLGEIGVARREHIMNGMTRWLSAFAGLLLAALAPVLAAAQERGGQDDARRLTEAYNVSGLALFKRLSEQPGNVVLSPFSIGSAMAMALSGARGETAQEMAQALHQSLDRPAMEVANAAVLAALARYDQSGATPRCPSGMQPSGSHCESAPRADGQCNSPARLEGGNCVAAGSLPPSARVSLANALMLTRRGDLIAKDYSALLANRYGAEIFQNAGLDEINGWVKSKTEGRIEKIIEQLDPLTVAVILDAIYFKAKWAATFAKAATGPQPFNLSVQEKVSVPTMVQHSNHAIATRPGYRAIRLPYEVDQLAMIIVLPDAIDGIDTVLTALGDKEWTRLADELRAPAGITAVDLALPRFKTSFSADLVPLFRSAGMASAFDPTRADFSGMTGRSAAEVPLVLDAIEHRAFIEVMEDGTEAAAATAVVVAVRSAARVPQKEEAFHVDRPFAFAIVDNASGAVLFEGRIADPR